MIFFHFVCFFVFNNFLYLKKCSSEAPDVEDLEKRFASLRHLWSGKHSGQTCLEHSLILCKFSYKNNHIHGKCGLDRTLIVKYVPAIRNNQITRSSILKKKKNCCKRDYYFFIFFWWGVKFDLCGYCKMTT